ncbi:MAG TPA: LysR substrate-binding domain-containing protein [Sphingomonas sp.]|nr:LysR substrate-binding domain-containing protein [Sphingomonas sp.]
MLSTDALPPLVSIRAFEAAARHGSFAAAARELGTTAAAVSYHVRQLERFLGFQLFVRHAQRVTLTVPGATVAGEASRTFAALRASFARAASEDQGVLSLTVLPSFGTSWLTPRLGRFRALNPGLRIELELSAEARDLGASRFDAAIRNGDGKWPGMIATRLFPAVFTPLCAPGLAAAGARIDEVGAPDVPLLGRRDWWEIWFRDGGQAVPEAGRFPMSLEHEHLDIAAAVAGQGIAIGSPIIFAGDLAAGRLVAPHPRIASDGRAFWLTWPAVRRDSAKLARLRVWLLHELAADEGSASSGVERAR